MGFADQLIPPKIESLLQFDGLLFREVRYANDFMMPRHSHNEAHLFVCLAGTILNDRPQDSRRLTPSMLAFLPGGEPHANFFDNSARTFDIVLKPHWIDRLRQFSSPVNRPMEYQNAPPVWAAMRLYREFQNQDNLTPLILEGLTLELLALMTRHSADGMDKGIPRWLTRAKDFLHAHFTENLSLDRIAVAVGVHPDHLTRAFRRHYRCTIGDYLRQQRVEYACHLLAKSDMPLSQIAIETGFADQSHFHRNFKSLRGMTPTQFQKSAAHADSRQETLL